MNKTPRLSVIVPTYNRAALLHLTLRSLVEQTLNKDDFEVIVVDDGSLDDSPDIVRTFSGKLNIEYLWQEDKGFRVAGARNKGALLAKAPYLVFIDSGISLASAALENMLNGFLTPSTKPKAIIGFIHGFGVEDEYTLNQFRHLARGSADHCIRWLKKHSLYDPRKVQYDELGIEIDLWPAPFDIFWGGLMGVERKQFQELGGFDQHYNSWGGEDVDLGIRLFLQGCQFVLAEQVESYHYPHITDSNIQKECTALACAKKLHDKYGLWQTDYYNYNEDHAVMTPLNLMITRMKARLIRQEYLKVSQNA